MSTYVLATLILCIIASTIFTIFSFEKNLANLFLKTLSSMLFTILGLFSLYFFIVYGGLKNTDNHVIGAFLMFGGLLICLIGDMILGMPRISELKRDRLPIIVGGATWFALGHIIYCTALIMIFGMKIWTLAIILPLCIFYTFGNKIFGKLNYGKLTIGILLYSLLESLSYALCIMALIETKSLASILLTIGFTLFFFSDMVLMHNYFGKPKRVISILCHSTYYPAQILIALSIAYIAFV